MAELPKLGIVTLLNSMLDSSEKEQEGDKVSPIAEPITLDDWTRAGIIEACEEGADQPCVCGALVKCTSSMDTKEKVHMIKESKGRAVKVAHIEQLNETDITRERPFSGCRLSDDGKCIMEEEYIEGKAWQGVDGSVGSDPDMKFKQELPMQAIRLLPYVDVPDRDGENKQWALNVNESYMVCTYGYGLIYFADAGQSYVNAFLDEAKLMEEPYEEPEEIEWIPSQVMQLGGQSEEEQYLTSRIEELNGKITDKRLEWNQEKIDTVWRKCREFYDEYGVQIDPRMMLAIIIAEGTGSFNTSSANKAEDGGNGSHSDFEKDCENAIDLLGGKIIAYLQYHDEFTAVVQENAKQNLPGMEKINESLKKYDDEKVHTIDFLHYLNWETPRLSLNEPKFIIGYYAVDNNWHSHVRGAYSILVDNNESFETSDYTEYLLGLDESIFSDLAHEKGINVSKPVTFKVKQNGADDKGEPNNEYTVVGVWAVMEN